ncbi:MULTISPECIES: biopolymer transporter ExbD [Metallibacterium]|jgi:biopolymer transport protein ExbD|uniref:ExbD/TolR family protein n=1 Tax=Metallibacterium TaxID=1218803 RepID=UPI00260FFE58|nr:MULTISPECIES: biopolymer transporter ExbD [Metallibacterium]MBW8076440.1 biopolymer transporter ExbD [Metallibacterium scheffleri]
MAMSSGAGANSGAPMSEINVTPLVDVMLVLLIIFMITAPLAAHKIKVDLPTANPTVQPADKTGSVDLAVKNNGSLYWNDSKITENEMKARFAVEAAKNPQPEIHLRADRSIRFKEISRILSDAKQSGIIKIGFITTGKN